MVVELGVEEKVIGQNALEGVLIKNVLELISKSSCHS